jgi:hypothetical protein
MKEIIDNWFRRDIKKLKSIISYWKNYHGRKYDINDMVSDVYIHVMSNIQSLNNESDLEAMVYNYIKNNSYWSLSKINKDYKTDKEYLTQGKLVSDFELDNSDREYIMELEKRIDYMYDFRNTLSDIEERIYFTKYLELLQDGEKPSTRRMKDVFGIKHYQSAILSKNLLERLNDFLVKNNYKKVE